MSGYSKWSTIKRQKGVTDTKRGQTFTKLSLAITMAVKLGGGITDPNSNFKLRLAIDAARGANMPKENINRAIERASGKQAEAVSATVYEGFGPHGIMVIVEAATDNKQRTTAEVQNIFNKSGGHMGQIGSVSYQFKQLGKIAVEKNGKTMDDIFLLAADSGAEDVEEDEDTVYIFTVPTNLTAVSHFFLQQGLIVSEEELLYVPQNIVTITDKVQAESIDKFLGKMEDLQDVQKVYSNADIIVSQ